MNQRYAVGVVFLLAAATAVAEVTWSFAEAQFQRLAGTSTPVPAGAGNFSRFSDVVLDGDSYAFIGYDGSDKQGIYTVSGGQLLRIADTQTPIPGGTGTFTIFGLDAGNGIGLAWRDGQLAFHAWGADGQRGIYAMTDDGLVAIADTNTTVPGTANKFRVFSAPVVDSGYVVFAGGYTNEGIWASSGGTLSKAASAENLGSGYRSFSLPSLDGTVVAFVAANEFGSPDIFKLNLADGTFATSLGRGTQVPGQDSFIWDVSNLVLRDGVIAFSGLALPNDSDTGVAGSGVYTDDGGNGLRAVAYDTQRDRLSNFAAYGGLSVSGGTIAFRKVFNNIDQGIFADQAGVLSQVVKPNDTPGGHAVQGVYSYAGSLDGNRLLFVGFYYPSYSLFLAYEPTSGTVCPPVVPTGSLPVGTLGAPYQRPLSVSGGAGPYTYGVASGALPGGLALGTNGVISGTPTATGEFAFAVQATDANSCSGASAFELEVVPDEEPPMLEFYSPPAEATSAAGAVVHYSVYVSDNVDPAPQFSCSPGPGSTFALGTTIVECSATDNSGNSTSLPFDVTVVDTTAPALQLPATISVNAQDPSDGDISFTVSASDAVDSAPVVVCDAASGSRFPLGLTTVSCSAVDAHDNLSTGEFYIEITDTGPPVLTVPPDIEVVANSAEGVAVLYEASATDGFDPAVVADCVPASGSTFPIGTTTVQCTAIDGFSNTASASFNVRVEDGRPADEGGGGGALPGPTLLLFSLMAAASRRRGVRGAGSTRR